MTIVTAMLPAKEVAALLCLSPRKIYQLASSGELPCYRFGGALRFDPADVEAYKAACRVKTLRRRDEPRSERPTVRLETGVDDGGLAEYFRQAGIKPRSAPASAQRAFRK